MIVDDEALARRRLRSLLGGEPDIEIVGECGGRRIGGEGDRGLAPDLVFLDVQMPEADGFDVLDAVGAERCPSSCSLPRTTTTRSGPSRSTPSTICSSRSRATGSRPLSRAPGRRSGDAARTGRATGEELAALLRELREAGRRPQRLVVRDGGRVSFLRAEEIDWVESAGNYLRIHVGSDAHLVRGTIKGCAERLDSESFVRISRSTIVNLDRVRSVHPWTRGELVVVLRDGTQLPTTGDHGRRLRERLKPGL